jgi:hypothetical protein
VYIVKQQKLYFVLRLTLNLISSIILSSNEISFLYFNNFFAVSTPIDRYEFEIGSFNYFLLNVER